MQSKPIIPAAVADRRLTCLGERHKNKMANPSAKASIHHPGEGGVLSTRGGRGINFELVVEEGGSVLIVNVDSAAAPLLRFRGDVGLNVQDDPAMKVALQLSVTLLEMLLSGVTVSTIEPD
jgi:hypothetical protein